MDGAASRADGRCLAALSPVDDATDPAARPARRPAGDSDVEPVRIEGPGGQAVLGGDDVAGVDGRVDAWRGALLGEATDRDQVRARRPTATAAVPRPTSWPRWMRSASTLRASRTVPAG